MISAVASKTKSLGRFSWQFTLARRQKSSIQRLSFEDKYRTFTFGEIHRLSSKLRDDLCSHLNKPDLGGEKIAVLCANNYSYLISVLGVWMANGVPIGLNKLYPNHLLEYFINDSKSRLVINGKSKILSFQ